MAKRKDDHVVIIAELRACNMLYMLEHGFVPKEDEIFIDALFIRYEDLTDPQKARFKDYIRAHGTRKEKLRLNDLD